MCDKKDYILLERLRKLIDTDTRENIAKSLGCDTSYITKHYNGDRTVTAEYLYKYSKHFNVSSDYLLGLSNAKTTNKDLKFICDYTGLCEEAVNSFRYISISTDTGLNCRALDFDFGLLKCVNYLQPTTDELIKSHCFRELIESVAVCKVISETIDEICNINDKDISLNDTALNNSIKEFCEHWFREYKYRIFSAQNSIADFIKQSAPIIDEHTKSKKTEKIREKILLTQCEEVGNNE